MKNVLLTEFTVKPSMPAPNVRTNGGRVVHAGHFARVSGRRFRAAAWCHAETSEFWDFTMTGDPVTCSHCRTRLQAADRPGRGVTDVLEVTRLRFRLWKELEEQVLVPDPVPWFLPRSSWPTRAGWFHEILKEVRDLESLVSAATPGDADEVRGCFGLGAERIAALLAEADDVGPVAA